jgi:hypothetical protein
MIINHFNPEYKLNRANEFEIWHGSVALPTRGSCMFALGIYAFQKGIPLKIVVGETEYKFPGYKFKAYKKREIDIAALSTKMYLEKAKSLGITVEERDFTLDEAKEMLKQGKVLLMRLVIGILRGSKENKRNPHYVPVYGIEKDKFLVMDPKMGILKVDEATMKESFDKVTEIKRDHRMIVFGQSVFELYKRR